MSKWRETTLGEVGAFVRGKRFTKNDYVDSGLGCIHYGQMYTHFGSVARETLTFIPEDMRGRMRLASPGDVVVAATSENTEDLGKATAWLGVDDIAVHDDCYIFKHHLDPTFASYVFASPSFDEQKVRYAAGTKVTRISGADLAKIEVAVPPLAEQRCIVDVVASVDGQIGALEVEAASLEAVAQLVADSTFDAAALRGSVVRLDALVDRVQNGVMYKRGAANGGWPVTRIETISGGRLDVSKTGRAGFDGENASAFVLGEGDVLFSNKNSLDRVGTTALVRARDLPLINGDNVLRLRPDRAEPPYLLAVLRSRQMRQQIRSITRPAVSQASVNAAQVKSLSIPTLDKVDQVRWGDAYLSALTAIEEAEGHVDSLRVLRSTLLTALLSQSISIPESYDALLDATPSALEGAPT